MLQSLWSNNIATLFVKPIMLQTFKDNTGLPQKVFLIIIFTPSMYDQSVFYKIQRSGAVPNVAQGRDAASHFQFEV